MSGEEKTHTKGEVDLLLAVAEVKTMQKMAMANFTSHTREDDVNFGKLFSADKEIIAKIDNIPIRMIECSEKIKTDILKISRSEFATITDFEVFKTEVKTSVKVGVAMGSISGTVIVTIIYAAWTLIKQGVTS